MIGLYCPQNTLIHRLKPGIKLVSLSVFAIAIFAVSSISVLLLFLSLLALLYRAAKVPFKIVFKQFKSMSLFLALIFIFQVFSSYWLVGFEVILRLVILVFLASLISFTTKVSDMVSSIESGLRPFRCFGINPSKFSMVLSMTIRFIPVVGEKFNEVREAQQARGLDANIFSLAIPLIIRTIKMASEVAEALDARSYDDDIGDRA
ncbi:energy-coupling factor transporter transmembrane component T family protein [Bartonella sp. CB178]|uniref:energy-coupling factor transporter transmembrane component T family protein n=1 Tax=Bartonella sp. CB178 TaxID=3112255 RepID=UPI00300E1E1F